MWITFYQNVKLFSLLKHLQWAKGSCVLPLSKWTNYWTLITCLYHVPILYSWISCEHSNSYSTGYSDIRSVWYLSIYLLCNDLRNKHTNTDSADCKNSTWISKTMSPAVLTLYTMTVCITVQWGVCVKLFSDHTTSSITLCLLFLSTIKVSQ